MHTDPATSSDSPRLQTLSREAFWQHHVTQWRDSGLTKVEYCQQHSLVYHQMVYWSTKAAEKKQCEAEEISQDFVPVTIASAPQCSTTGLSLHLANGMTIEGIDEYSVSLVSKLIEQL